MKWLLAEVGFAGLLLLDGGLYFFFGGFLPFAFMAVMSGLMWFIVQGCKASAEVAE